jgi:signal transduction histidine kinase
VPKPGAKIVEWHRACGVLLEQRLKDGRWIRAIERRTSDGRIVGIRTDITAAKHTEAALRFQVANLEEARLRLTDMATDLVAARDAADAANLAKSQFLANMSHELRTPLNAIIGFSEMLTKGIVGPLSPKQDEYAEIINKSGNHLLEIINEVLDLAKIDAGKAELHEKPTDPISIAQACLEIVKEHAYAGVLSLSMKSEGPIPALLADARRLKQILLNLVSNAIKFTEPGGSVTVAVRRTEDGGVAFEIRDTGAGMTAAEIQTAMQPFGQVDAGLNRSREGTGLGLPLARSLTELHGGSLHIESEKGRGTTAIVAFPAARVLVDLPEPLKTKPAAA